MFAVILGLSPTGLYAVRELGRAGIPVGGVAEGVQCGEASRFLTIRPAIRASNDDTAVVAALEALAALRGQRGLLIPTSDRFIELIVTHHDRLSRHFDFQASYSPAMYDGIVDKGRFLARCEAAGIAHPGYREVTGDGLAGVVAAVRFPLIVKPALIHHVKDYMAGRKVLIARNRAELDAIARALPQGAETTWLVQEIVAGPESNITLFAGYVDRTGTVRQAFTARKLRQYVPGFGSASLVVSETLPETRAAAERLLGELGFHGIAGVEFKTDARDQSLRIIEVNPRPSLWFGIASAAGRRVALAAWNEITGTPPLVDTPQRDGVVWRYALKDWYAARWYRGNAKDFVLPPPELPAGIMRQERVNAVYARDDAAPALREMQNYAVKAARRVIGGGSK